MRLVLIIALLGTSNAASAQVDSGEIERLLDSTLEQFFSFGEIAAARLVPYAMWLAFTLAVIDFIWALSYRVASDLTDISFLVIRKIVLYGAVFWLIQNAYGVFTEIINTYEFLASEIVGGRSATQLVYNIADILFELMRLFFADLGATALLTNIGPALFIAVFAAPQILRAIGSIIAEMISSLAEAGLMIGLVVFQIAFGNIWLARETPLQSLRYFIAVGLRLLVLFVILAVIHNVLLTIYTPIATLISTENFDGLVSYTIVLVIFCYIARVLATRVPSIVDATVLGRPLSDARDLAAATHSLRATAARFSAGAAGMAASTGAMAGARGLDVVRQAASNVKSAAGRGFSTPALSGIGGSSNRNTVSSSRSSSAVQSPSSGSGTTSSRFSPVSGGGDSAGKPPPLQGKATDFFD